MTGMTTRIARIVSNGNITLGESARRLGMTREQLDSRLLLMERQGYLTRLTGTAPEAGCSCGGCCTGCSNDRNHPPLVMFALTKKGMRLIRSADPA
jgi:DNA-binding HxlR family transcriptional regulator